MNDNKCPKCGASATTVSKEGKTVCAYCKHEYRNTTQNNDFSNSVNKKYLNGPRPTLNVIALVFLFIVWWPIGLIYLIITSSKQKEWDTYHGIHSDDDNNNT